MHILRAILFATVTVNAATFPLVNEVGQIFGIKVILQHFGMLQMTGHQLIINGIKKKLSERVEMLIRLPLNTCANK